MKITLLLFSVFFLLFPIGITAQIAGCTDPVASNFDPSATLNDGSCMYNPVSILPTSSFNLADNLLETSGLILWNNYIWTHNDSDDVNIYALDTINGNLIQAYTLDGELNTDWEEISQDEDFIYVGDFGNNSNGNRTKLQILRIDKNSLLSGVPIIETINFSYSDQTSFEPTGLNNTDFDCEAFIVSSDSIYLFTKQWISNKTSVYALPKIPGTYIAKLKSTFDVQGLITGATYLEAKKLIVLSGYSKELQPFLFLFYDFSGSDVFGGNKRKITVSLPFHQVEGITTTDGIIYYISNEQFVQATFINTPQKLHILDLTSFLSVFLNSQVTLQESRKTDNSILFPNPVNDFVRIKTDKQQLPDDFIIISPSGQIVLKGKLTQVNQKINISELSAGMYILKIYDVKKSLSLKVIKK